MIEEFVELIKEQIGISNACIEIIKKADFKKVGFFGGKELGFYQGYVKACELFLSFFEAITESEEEKNYGDEQKE